MQDSELHGQSVEQSDRLLSDLALTRRQSRSLYRNWVALSKKSTGYSFQSQNNVAARFSSSTLGNDIDFFTESSCSLIEDRADEIVRHMERSQTLMEDNPRSNNERIESLRLMTEYLTLKRSVKRKLTKSIGSTGKGLSLSKRLRYRISIFFCKIPVAVKNFLGNFELWYSSLKVIEGHFGSSVASYFKFLRKLFLLNACIFILILFFIMIPQLLFRFIQYVDDNEFENNNSTGTANSTDGNRTNSGVGFVGDGAKASRVVMIRNDPYGENAEFRFGNLFTGEGFLTNTILFYGYYTNTSLTLFDGYHYNIPASYFFTSAVSYALIFFFLFISVAVSYRKCYIETSSGMNNTFSNKIFCGWDFGIATRQAAELKSRSIYIEIKELLDEVSKPKRKRSCAHNFYTTAISFSLNGILLFLLGVGGMYSWKYLDQQMTKADTATTMMMWLILTLVIAVAPVLFSLITHIEGFELPSSALYMTLIRTFTLYAVVVAVVVAYRLNRTSESECWETILGQDMYRLVLLDFLFGLMGTTLSEFIRYRIFVKMWEGIGCPEFDIARSTMNLIYNQTLFYVGLFFSPVLSLIITIKMFLTFYIKKWGAIYNCKPFLNPWRASQAHTVYLSIAFFSFFSVVIAYGYVVTSVKTSNCGPFRGEKFMYESILYEITNKDSPILTGLYYITRPGIVGILLMALGLGVYYMRAVAMARLLVVNHLRHLLLLKAEDRKILLSEISKYTKAQHQAPRVREPRPAYTHRMGEGSVETAREAFQRSRGSKKKKCAPGTPSPERERNLRFRKKNFNSVQDLRSPSMADEAGPSSSSLERKPRPNEIFEVVELNHVPNSDWGPEESGQDPVQEYQEESGTKESGDVDVEAQIPPPSKVILLNFNPVFTESFQLQGENEEVEHLVERANESQSQQPNGSFGPSEDNPILPTDQNESDASFKNYLRFHERVPSRISFPSTSDSSSPLKKKKR